MSTRLTKQQQVVADLLRERGDFRSAQQIHHELREQGQSVGLATVYRSLALLAQGGEVDLLLREDGESVYRRCSELHHHHLVCRTCGRTVEVAGPAVESWADRVAAEHGFADVSHTVELFGLCRECRQPDPGERVPRAEVPFVRGGGGEQREEHQRSTAVGEPAC